MKQCSKCRIEKAESEYYKCCGTRDGLQNYCRACSVLRMRSPQYRTWARDYEKLPHVALRKRRRLASPKGKAYTRRWILKHPEKIRAYAHNYATSEKGRSYKRRYFHEVVMTNPQTRIAHSIRRRLWDALKRRGAKKTISTIKLIGCSLQELVAHIGAQFQPGMSWDNHGEWHIDHIKPLASFDLTNKRQLAEACNYTNLQPLWAADNIRKHAHIFDATIQPAAEAA